MRLTSGTSGGALNMGLVTYIGNQLESAVPAHAPWAAVATVRTQPSSRVTATFALLRVLLFQLHCSRVMHFVTIACLKIDSS